MAYRVKTLTQVAGLAKPLTSRPNRMGTAAGT
jgi:hypothetical protein